MSTKPNWIDRAAWVAEQVETEFLKTYAGLRPSRNEDGLNPAHLLFMIQTLKARELTSETKACRWLGWMQAGVSYHGIMALDQMKALNLASGKIQGSEQHPSAEPMLAADRRRMRTAGTKLAEAALHVIREYDGTHRLALAVADWATAVANEGGREERHAPWTEEQDFMIEAALFHGFMHQSDDGENFLASKEAVVRLMNAAREQGRKDRALYSRRELEKKAAYQERCWTWFQEVAKDDPTDLGERRARFLEEALELCQALHMTEYQAELLVKYVFGRATGDAHQEYGGTKATLATLAAFTGHDLDQAGEDELKRCQRPEVMAKIRHKRAGRHGRGPLPGADQPLVPGCVSFYKPCKHQKDSPGTLCAECRH